MSNIGPIKAYYDAKSIHEVEPHLERIKSGLFQGFMQSHPIGYWQFHQFKYKPGMSFVKASYAECFMHLLVECQANCRPETCFLVIYSGQRGPFGKPSHCITLISKGDKLYNMGQKKATGPTQRDMVRIIPRDKGDGKKILCFSVGKKNISAFAKLLKPYVKLIAKGKNPLTGATIGPFDDPDLQASD